MLGRAMISAVLMLLRTSAELCGPQGARLPVAAAAR